MNSIKPHIAPTLHNAVGGLIAASIIALLGGATWFFKTLRDLSVPLWLMLLLVAAWTSALIVLSRKTNQKHCNSLAEINRLNARAVAEAEQRHVKEIQEYHNLATELMEMVRSQLEDKKPQPPSRLQELNEKLTRLLGT